MTTLRWYWKGGIIWLLMSLLLHAEPPLAPSQNPRAYRLPLALATVKEPPTRLVQLPRAKASSLDQQEFIEVMRLLKKKGGPSLILPPGKMDPTTLHPFLKNLGPTVSLVSTPLLPPSQWQPLSTELLPHHIGYWRLPSFLPPQGWEMLGKELAQWKKQGLIGMVLDLRSFQATNDFEGASQIASFFTPPHFTLFSIQGLQIPQKIYKTAPQMEHFTGPIILLTHPQIQGAAEALAASMRESRGALLIGRSTSGRAALWEETPLSSGRFLHFASGEVLLPNGNSLFGQPIRPDIALFIPEQEEKEVLEILQKKGAYPVIKERPQRSRLNEATLIRRQKTPPSTSSETTAPSTAQQDPLVEKKYIQDIALIRAMDILRAIQITHEPKTTPPLR